MLDCGYSVSLIDKGSVPKQCIVSGQMPQLQTANGHKLTVMETVKAHLQLEQFSTEYGILVTNSLITPVILGIDFLSMHKVRLDYSTDPVSIHVGGFICHIRTRKFFKFNTKLHVCCFNCRW